MDFSECVMGITNVYCKVQQMRFDFSHLSSKKKSKENEDFRDILFCRYANKHRNSLSL